MKLNRSILFLILSAFLLALTGCGDNTSAGGSTADTTPDAFTFTAQTSVALGATVTSNSITVSGIDSAASISVIGGSYSIDNGAFTSAAGTVNNGQTVRVQHTASSSANTDTTTTLTIGGVSAVFKSTTAGGTPSSDTTPDAFTFTDQTDVATGATVTSNAITVSGINAAAAISVTGGSYSIGNGAFTTAAGTVTNGQTVRVQHTAASAASTATSTTLTIGGISATFKSTTKSGGTDPAGKTIYLTTCAAAGCHPDMTPSEVGASKMGVSELKGLGAMMIKGLSDADLQLLADWLATQ